MRKVRRIRHEKTAVVAARVPATVAELLRREAAADGVSTSRLLGRYLIDLLRERAVYPWGADDTEEDD